MRAAVRLPTRAMPQLPLHPVLRGTLAACCSLLLAGGTAAQQAAKPATAPAKPAAKTAPKPAPKPAPATAKQKAADAAKGLALATETTEAINDTQLDIAARVLTGTADCEFNQKVVVQPLDGKAGYFTVIHQGKHYRMLPRETSTGAVRLEDPVNGLVWLQIPAKSMLMNAFRGQRLVDGCMHSEQRAAVAAATAAGHNAAQGIGIVPQVATTPVAATPADTPASR